MSGKKARLARKAAARIATVNSSTVITNLVMNDAIIEIGPPRNQKQYTAGRLLLAEEFYEGFVLPPPSIGHLDSEEGDIFLVGLHGDEVIAAAWAHRMTITANFYLIQGDWEAALVLSQHYRLKGIAVKPQWRKHGIGTRLLTQVRDMASQVNAHGINAAVEDMPALVEFYQKCGYHVTEPGVELEIPMPTRPNQPITIPAGAPNYRWAILDPLGNSFFKRLDLESA